jgi:hypothetical protein
MEVRPAVLQRRRLIVYPHRLVIPPPDSHDAPTAYAVTVACVHGPYQGTEYSMTIDAVCAAFFFLLYVTRHL